jgi:hypothetical protein
MYCYLLEHFLTLVYQFKYGIVVADIEFIHMCPLFTKQNCVIFF